MNFSKIALNRQSCRSYDKERAVEEEKLSAVLESAILAPSACNSQPYHFTVCKGDLAKRVAECTMGMGMNRFSADAPVIIVVSEDSYSASAAIGSKLKHNDYRSIDIGIAVAYLTSEATAQGLSSCILGWFDNDKIKKLCALDTDVRLVVTLGYHSESDSLRVKKRKDFDKIVTFMEEDK